MKHDSTLDPSTTSLWHVMEVVTRDGSRNTNWQARMPFSLHHHVYFDTRHVMQFMSRPCQTIQVNQPDRRWQVQGRSQERYVGERTSAYTEDEMTLDRDEKRLQGSTQGRKTNRELSSNKRQNKKQGTISDLDDTPVIERQWGLTTDVLHLCQNNGGWFTKMKRT
jgi:hypothetical protein